MRIDPYDASREQDVRALLDEAYERDDHTPLSDAKRLQFERRSQPFDGFVASKGDTVVGYAHLSRGNLEIVATDTHVEEALLEHAGPSVRVVWLRDPTRADERRLASRGFRPDETLLQMRRPIPDGLEQTKLPPGTRLRTFEPGRDEQEWLEVNRLAFATHRDQATWTLEQLEMRMAERWFDPEGFLIAQDAQGMAGFCWTKVHERPRLGEIYVIAAHPSRQGTGLGRALVVAGLRSLADRGLDTGMLYTDAANEAAVHLYRTLGCEVHHMHRTFVR